MSRFVRLNQRAAMALDRRWPYSGARVWQDYPRVVAGEIHRLEARVVVDVGAGTDSHFPRFVSGEVRPRIIGVDVLGDAMDRNPDLAERRVGDIVNDQLLAEGEADVVVSRAVLEHLRDVEAFFRAAFHALRPGGAMVHIFSTRRAPFALINRLLPARFGTWLLFKTDPGAAGQQGFPAYYDRGTASESVAALQQAGFEISDVRLSYRTSQYFRFFIPVYVLARIYEELLGRIGARALASYVLVVAHRPSGPRAGYQSASGE